MKRSCHGNSTNKGNNGNNIIGGPARVRCINLNRTRDDGTRNEILHRRQTRKSAGCPKEEK